MLLAVGRGLGSSQVVFQTWPLQFLPFSTKTLFSEITGSTKMRAWASSAGLRRSYFFYNCLYRFIGL